MVIHFNKDFINFLCNIMVKRYHFHEFHATKKTFDRINQPQEIQLPTKSAKLTNIANYFHILSKTFCTFKFRTEKSVSQT